MYTDLASYDTNLLRIAIMLVASSVLVVGCAEGGSDGTSAQRAIEEADQRRAEAALLTLTDFPPGWTASEEDGDEDEDEEAGARNACTEEQQPDLSSLTVTGDANGGTFEYDDAWVYSWALVYRTEEDAREAFEQSYEVLASDEFAACFGEQFADAMADGEIGVGETSANTISVPAVVEQTGAVRLKIPLEVEGQTVPAFMEFIALLEERMIGGMTTFEFEAPFPTTQREGLVEILADRLAP